MTSPALPIDLNKPLSESSSDSSHLLQVNLQTRALLDDAIIAIDCGDNLRASRLLRSIPSQSSPSLLAIREALLDQVGPSRVTIALVALCAAVWVALAWWVLA